MGELGIVVSGGTPSTKEPLFWEGDITWVTPADLSDYKGKYLRKDFWVTTSNKQLAFLQHIVQCLILKMEEQP